VGEFQIYGGLLQRGYRTLNSRFGNPSKVFGNSFPNGNVFKEGSKIVEDLSF
jgi:hypothetical protein